MQPSTALALAMRTVIALVTRTFFQPDEYFQALEPAHVFVFGYGDLTWEWTSKPPIRSPLYPVLNVPIYWLLKILCLDETFLLVRFCILLCRCCTHERKIAAPKMLHGLLAAGTDIWVRELSEKTLGQRYVHATVSMTYPRFVISDIECLQVLSLLDVLLSRVIPISFVVQLSGNNLHNYRFVLLPLGRLSSPLQVC
jgi:GPI mannosyltransferase 3